VTAGDVYRALWRYKVLIAVLTAACVAVTWFVTSRQDKTYVASTLVRVEQPVTSSGSSFAVLEATARRAETYAQVIDSGALDDRVGRIVRGRVPADEAADPSLGGDPVQDLDLLWISARSHDPATAQTLANATADALTALVADSPGPDEIVTVKQATRPTSAVSPRVTLNVVLALVLGLIFNSALALLLEVFRDRLPDSDELARTLGYPVLATVPVLQLRRMPSRSGEDGAGSDRILADETADGPSRVAPRTDDRPPTG
jgi:capsular polysaccharide biosynthesis protein